MNALRRYRYAALVSLAWLTGCFNGPPPTEQDVAAVTREYLAMSNAINGWKPTKVQVSNLKCNRSTGDTYACSFDVEDTLERVSRMDSSIEVRNFSHKNQTGRYRKSGNVWTAASQ